jgi:hypothetical protein
LEFHNSLRCCGDPITTITTIRFNRKQQPDLTENNNQTTIKQQSNNKQTTNKQQSKQQSNNNQTTNKTTMAHPDTPPYPHLEPTDQIRLSNSRQSTKAQ